MASLSVSLTAWDRSVDDQQELLDAPEFKTIPKVTSITKCKPGVNRSSAHAAGLNANLSCNLECDGARWSATSPGNLGNDTHSRSGVRTAYHSVYNLRTNFFGTQGNPVFMRVLKWWPGTELNRRRQPFQSYNTPYFKQLT